MVQVHDRRITPLAAYIHIPFCVSKCFYCDFNSYSGKTEIFDAYTNSVILDISRAPFGPPLETVYFGGGTPTILGADRLCDILCAVDAKYSINADAEVSVEANPGTVTSDMLAQMRETGFNRLSFGAQSFQDRFLKTLGRAHSVTDIHSALAAAREAGFESLSLDLMYGLPDQNVNDWLSDLSIAASLGLPHLSAYELTIEDDTPLARAVAIGELSLPSEDEQIEMVTKAQELLHSAGYERYEVSNYCKPGFECRHNLMYWHNEAHWAFGAGAVGYSSGVRSIRLQSPDEYIESIRCDLEPIQSSEIVTGRLLEAETLMMGLRLTEGIMFCILDTMSQETRDTACNLIAVGLLETSDGMLRTTEEGYLKLSDVAESFLP